MKSTATVSKWGNSKGIRIPAELLNKAQINLNDQLFFEVDEQNRIILTKTPTPKEGTLEFLFKDYTGGVFKTKLINPDEPIGNEQW